MMRIGSSSLLPFALSAVIGAGCSKDVLFEEVTRTSLTTSGGEAFSADGTLKLEVPQGSLPSDTRITIRTKRGADNHASLVKPIYDLSADPPVAAFDPPIAIEIGGIPDDGHIYMLVNTDGSAPVEVPGSMHDLMDRAVRGSLSHFSGYSAAPVDPGFVCPPQNEAIGASCDEEGARCDYGQECCCGQCYVAFTCLCSGGVLNCMYTDSCLIPECPDAGTPDTGTSDSGSGECPATQEEAIGGSCSDDGLRCEYGQECCCGQCYPAVVCDCNAPSFACHYTDSCLIPECPDGGT